MLPWVIANPGATVDEVPDQRLAGRLVAHRRPVHVDSLIGPLLLPGLFRLDHRPGQLFASVHLAHNAVLPGDQHVVDEQDRIGRRAPAGPEGVA